QEPLDPRLDRRKDSHPAQFCHHVGNARRPNRKQPTADAVTHLEDDDRPAWVLTLEPPGGVESRDASADDGYVDGLVCHWLAFLLGASRLSRRAKPAAFQKRSPALKARAA